MIDKNTVKRVLVIGWKNRVGNFDGLDEETLNTIVQETMDKAMNAFKEELAEYQEKIEYMLADKMEASLLQISLDAKENSERSISNQIKENVCNVGNALGGAVENIKAELENKSTNVEARLDKLGRTFSNEAAKAVQQLNDIQDSLQVFQEKNLELDEKTYAEIMIMAHAMGRLEASNRAIKEQLSDKGLKDSETHEKILKKLEEVLSEIRSAKSEKAKSPQSYDQIVYERMDEAKDIEKGQAIVLKSVKDYESSKNADSIVNEIDNQLKAWVNFVKGEFAIAHQEHKDIVEIGHNIEDIAREILKNLVPAKHQHGEDCVRCGAPEARIYKCDICDSMPGESDGSSATVWGSDWWDGEGLMLVRGEGFENQTVNLRNYAESLPPPAAEMIQRIIFDTDVREIYCQDMDMGAPQYQNICTLFPNLKCLALRKPIDGQEQEYCVLGESLFSGCGHLRLYGMKYVKDLKPHCFAGWGITDENHNEFIDRYFSENLHTTLSAKGTRRKDWRT